MEDVPNELILDFLSHEITMTISTHLLKLPPIGHAHNLITSSLQVKFLDTGS